MSFPLNTLSANRYVLDNIALLGDAAHSIHPMAGQGLNLGLADSKILANEIIEQLRSGKDFGREQGLLKYELKAKANNYVMQAGLEVVKQSYGVNQPFLSRLRNLGVEIVQNSPLRPLAEDVASGKYFEDERALWKEN